MKKLKEYKIGNNIICKVVNYKIIPNFSKETKNAKNLSFKIIGFTKNKTKYVLKSNSKVNNSIYIERYQFNTYNLRLRQGYGTYVITISPKAIGGLTPCKKCLLFNVKNLFMI